MFVEYVIFVFFMFVFVVLVVVKIVFFEMKLMDFKISKEMELEVGYRGFFWYMLIKCILLLDRYIK